MLSILNASVAQDPYYVKRQANAAKAMARISHPNVVKIFDLGVTPAKTPFLAMEFVPGFDLRTILDTEVTLSQPRLRSLFDQVCLGLDAVHKARILHRNVKPANLVVSPALSKTEKEKATIIDFGSCSEVLPQGDKDHGSKSGPLVEAAGELIGSVYYMSPEQCLGNACDQRSDIYAVGCCMFEAMTGVKPFIGDTADSTMSMHTSVEPQLHDNLDADFEGLTAVILKCLAKSPEKRYQTMSDLRAALANLQVKGKPNSKLRNL